MSVIDQPSIAIEWVEARPWTDACKERVIARLELGPASVAEIARLAIMEDDE